MCFPCLHLVLLRCVGVGVSTRVVHVALSGGIRSMLTSGEMMLLCRVNRRYCQAQDEGSRVRVREENRFTRPLMEYR